MTSASKPRTSTRDWTSFFVSRAFPGVGRGFGLSDAETRDDCRYCAVELVVGQSPEADDETGRRGGAAVVVDQEGLEARNAGVVASFSRALTEGLRADQGDEEYDAALDGAIKSIYEASIA